MAAPRYRLRDVAVVNLRGFVDTSLEIGDGLTFLVGPNNSGKTSILRLIDWFLNEADLAVLKGERPLDAKLRQVLLPARATRNQARRLTLGIEIGHAATRRRYGCDDEGIVDLRATMWANGEVRVNVGPPTRGEAQDDDNRKLALSLVERLREAIAFTLIPASRDASSQSFRSAFRDAAVAKLERRALHTRTGRAPSHSQQISSALSDISDVAADLVSPLWEEMQISIPSGLARNARLGADIDARALVEWIADNTSMRLITGDHDEDGVAAVEVGSGLQSLLELAMNRAGGSEDGVELILAVEEPEAFLHPSAQRTLARLFRETDERMIVSTHSPVVVDEARYGEVVIARGHHFYEAREVDDERREQINSSLLTGHGSEMAFASSLLLVEGEGDELFFERVRRRIAEQVDDSRLDGLYVLPVGGKTGFAPWIRVLRSFGEEGNRPIEWHVVADDDAASEVRDAYSDAGAAITLPAVNAISTQRQVFTDATTTRTAKDKATADLNEVSGGLRFSLMPGELEGAMLEGTSPQTRGRLAAAMGPGAPTAKDDLATWLLNNKGPWLRALAGEQVPLRQITGPVRDVLLYWIAGATGPDDAEEIIKSMG